MKFIKVTGKTDDGNERTIWVTSNAAAGSARHEAVSRDGFKRAQITTTEFELESQTKEGIKDLLTSIFNGGGKVVE